MIEDVHQNSRIGQARSKLAALQAQLPPLQERLAVLRSERAEKQAIVDGATLDTPPIEVAMAESRIRLLDKAIARAADELAPLSPQLGQAEHELAMLEGDAEYKLAVFPELQDALNPDLSHYSIACWMDLLRDGRKAVQELTEAPLAPGVRYERVVSVSVSFRLMQLGEEVEKRGPSASERRHLAGIEQTRELERQISAGVVAFTHEPVIGLGREGVQP